MDRILKRDAPEATAHAAPVVYVVDDDISVRESLEGLINEVGWQVATFSSASEFLSHQHRAGPRCLVLDVSLPDLNGLDLQQRLSGEHEDMPIIFITGYGDVPTSVKAMKAGAVEFLMKPFGDQAVLDAISAALERSASTLDIVADTQSLKDRFAGMSPREREVMTLVVTGLMNKQVAGQLGISEITVKAHRGRVMQKMRARSFADLVNMAAKIGLHR